MSANSSPDQFQLRSDVSFIHLNWVCFHVNGLNWSQILRHSQSRQAGQKNTTVLNVLPSVSPCNVRTPELTARWSSVNKQLLTCNDFCGEMKVFPEEQREKCDKNRPCSLEKMLIPPHFSAATTDLPADDFILRVRADVHHVRP